MKLGILTYHKAQNYGAVLQTYASQEVLKQLGHDVEVVDYYAPAIAKSYRFFPPLAHEPFVRKLKVIVLFLLTLYKEGNRRRRRTVFHQFVTSKLQLSKQRYTQPFETELHYDMYYIGSDQVWNYDKISGFDSVYWGNFKVRDDARKMAYAASLSTSGFASECEDFCRKALDNFSSVSVREKQLVDLLQPLTTKKLTCVLDPTLLLTAADYTKIAVAPSAKRFVLAYALNGRSEVLREAYVMAKKLGCEVIELCGIISWRNSSERREYASPEEFLGYFMTAEYVVTSSFHGTAFSLIFHRPFTVFLSHNGGDNRLISLLSDVQMLNRIKGAHFDMDTCDWSRVDELLDQRKQESLQFITNALS